jgi:uncharacterized protein (TIGR02444 family)
MTDTAGVPNADGLWDFAVGLYGRPDAETVLLELQDRHGQSVPFLLWALWLAASGRAPDPAQLQTAAMLSDAWNSKVTAPLRTIRGGLKEMAQATDVARFREEVKALELESERILLAMLEAAAADLPAGATLARTLLNAAVEAWGDDAPPAVLLDRLASLAN